MINFAWKFSKNHWKNADFKKNNNEWKKSLEFKKFSKMLMLKKSKFSNGTELTNINEI